MPILETLTAALALLASFGAGPDVKANLTFATGSTFYRPVGVIDTVSHTSFRTTRTTYRTWGDRDRLCRDDSRYPIRRATHDRVLVPNQYYRTSGGRFGFHSPVFRDCGVRTSYRYETPVYRAGVGYGCARPIVYVSVRYR